MASLHVSRTCCTPNLISRLCHRRFSNSSLIRQQNRLPAAYYRGGTSRAVLFQQKDLPKDRSEWAPIFLGVLGSPDPYGRQLDGMGGGISSFSKICVVGPPSHSEADIDYTFAAIGVKNSDVDYGGNCGNMTSAIGPYAVDQRIVMIAEGAEEVTIRIHNTNTGKIIHSKFPVVCSEGATQGDFKIDGVSGTSARIRLDFIKPAGSKTGKLLPTGNVVDNFDGVRTTCVDVGNPCCFVLASDMGVDGGMTPDQIDAHPTLLERLDSIRRQAGVEMGLAKGVDEVVGSIPKICMVSAPRDANEVDLRVRAISVGQPHKALPITVALATAASSKIQGSVVNEVTSKNPVDVDSVAIGHASGRIVVGAKLDDAGELNFATIFSTARRLMEGTIYWK